MRGFSLNLHCQKAEMIAEPVLVDYGLLSRKCGLVLNQKLYCLAPKRKGKMRQKERMERKQVSLVFGPFLATL